MAEKAESSKLREQLSETEQQLRTDLATKDGELMAEKAESSKLREQLSETEQQLRTDLATKDGELMACLLYTSPSPRDRTRSRMPSSA